MQNAIAEVEKILGEADDLIRRRLQERALEGTVCVVSRGIQPAAKETARARVEYSRR